MRPGKLTANIVLALVLTIGTVNFLAQFVVQGYTPDPTITLLFAGVAGLILGVQNRVKDDSANARELKEKDAGGK